MSVMASLAAAQSRHRRHGGWLIQHPDGALFHVEDEGQAVDLALCLCGEDRAVATALVRAYPSYERRGYVLGIWGDHAVYRSIASLRRG